MKTPFITYVVFRLTFVFRQKLHSLGLDVQGLRLRA